MGVYVCANSYYTDNINIMLLCLIINMVSFPVCTLTDVVLYFARYCDKTAYLSF